MQWLPGWIINPPRAVSFDPADHTLHLEPSSSCCLPLSSLWGLANAITPGFCPWPSTLALSADSPWESQLTADSAHSFNDQIYGFFPLGYAAGDSRSMFFTQATPDESPKAVLNLVCLHLTPLSHLFSLWSPLLSQLPHWLLKSEIWELSPDFSLAFTTHS